MEDIVESPILRNKNLNDSSIDKENAQNITKSIVNDSDTDTESSSNLNRVISSIDLNDDGNAATAATEIDVEADVDAQQQQQQKNKTAPESGGLSSAATRPCQFSISRVKNIMKLDPELSLTSKESVFLVAKATEYFVDYISKEAYKYTLQGSRKTIQKKDIEQAVANIDPLYFLEAALD